MTAPTPDALPIEAAPEFADHAWSVRLPVRAEQITVSKQVVVRERVSLSRRRVDEIARVEAELRRQELRITTSGPVEVTETNRADIAHE